MPDTAHNSITNRAADRRSAFTDGHLPPGISLEIQGPGRSVVVIGVGIVPVIVLVFGTGARAWLPPGIGYCTR